MFIIVEDNLFHVERGRYYATSEGARQAATRKYGKNYRFHGFGVRYATKVCDCICGCTRIIEKGRGRICERCGIFKASCKPVERIGTTNLPPYLTEDDKRHLRRVDHDKKTAVLRAFWETRVPGLVLPGDAEVVAKWKREHPEA